MTGLALGIDLGTSGVRSAVVDRAGTVVAMARGSYGDSAQARRDPACWWAAVMACLAAQMTTLKAEGHDPAQIAGVAVDGTSGSLLLSDGALVPVGRSLMYDDGGFTDEAMLIGRVAPDPHITRGAGSALARALRLYAEDDGRHAKHLMHQADAISARLLGRAGWSDVNNSLKTGVDPATGQWPGWIARLPFDPALLPKAVAPGTPLGPIAPQMAQALGLPATAMVHAGTTDSIAAFLAAAAPLPGAAVTSLGTTLAVKLFSNRRIDAPEMGLYAHRLGPGWLVGGASNTGGGVLRSLFSDADLDRLSRRIGPPVESPLDYYPLLRPGERFPINDPAHAPRMLPRPEDDAAFLHGLLEGIARIERRAYELMSDLGGPKPKQIVTAGGGAANAVWSAIRARVMGLPVVPAKTPEAAVGSARLVWLGKSGD